MVSSRYGLDSGDADNGDADDSLTPESVPEGPVPVASSSRGRSPTITENLGNEISENLPFGVVRLDSAQNVIYCNPQQRDLLKIDIRECDGIEDWLRQGCRDDDYACQVIRSWREHIWRKQLTRVFSLKSADEKLREIEFRARLLDDGGLLLTLIDVTESRRSEDALRLTETKFNTVFEHVSIGVALVDRTGRFFEVNPSLERMLDYPRWELRRMALNELVPPEEFEQLRRIERELNAGIGGDERTLPLHFRKKDGETIGVDVTLSPIRDGSRHPLFTAYFIRDNGGDEEIREDLRQSQEQNRALLEAIPDLILLLDGSGRIEDLIPPAEEWQGIPVSSDWSGQNLEQLWPGFSRESREAIRRSLRSGSLEEFSFWETLDLDGREVCFSVRVAPCGIDQVVAVVADETDRELAREALSRQGVAFRHMKESVILADLHGRILDGNPAASEAFGYSAAELRGRGFADLYAGPEEAETLNREISEALTRDGEWRGTREFFRKDGRPGLCEAVIVPVVDEGEPLSLLAIHREITRETIDDVAGERVQHRIRNQLQMVGSLFGLESKHADGVCREREMLEKFQGRLRAMTRLQDSRLKGGQPGTVTLVSYAQVLADDLQRICPPRESDDEGIEVFGDESLCADLEVAAPFGLLVVEMGLALSRTSPGTGWLDDRKVTLIIQPGGNGDPQLVADLSAEVFEKLTHSTIECLVSQLRGKLNEVRQRGHTRLTVSFSPSIESKRNDEAS